MATLYERRIQEIVERVVSPSGVILLVDEEGLPKGLLHNPSASRIAGQPIVGNAIVLRGEAAEEGWK